MQTLLCLAATLAGAHASKIGLFYATTTGNTEDVADLIGEKTGLEVQARSHTCPALDNEQSDCHQSTCLSTPERRMRGAMLRQPRARNLPQFDRASWADPARTCIP